MTHPTLFLLGLVFLLFPLAHLRLIEDVPIYLSEIPLLFALAWAVASPNFFQNLKNFFQERKWVLLGTALFCSGALIPFFFKEVSFGSLGLLKSFILLPLLLMIMIGMFVRTAAEEREVLFSWWLGILASAVGGLFLLIEGALTYDGRLASFYASPNHFAMLLAPGILLGIFLYSTSQSKKRFLYVLGTFCILGALFATRSYASLGAVVGISFLLGFLYKSSVVSSWKHIFFLGFLLIGSWFFLEGTTEKFQALLDFEGRSSSASRLMIWESAWKISQDNFPWGIGIGRFQEVYLAYQRFFPPYLEWAVPEPHNLFLSLFLSTGILGLVGFLLIFLETGKKLWQISSKDTQPLSGKLYLSLLGWVILVGLVDTPYFKNDLSFLFWGVIGLSLAFLARNKEKETTD